MANVGGLMGLCIGFSFVSVVELVCFMCKSNKWIVCRQWRRAPAAAIKPFAKRGKKQGRRHERLVGSKGAGSRSGLGQILKFGNFQRVVQRIWVLVGR